MEQGRIDQLLENHTQQELVDIIDKLEEELVSKDTKYRQELLGYQTRLQQITGIFNAQSTMQSGMLRLVRHMSDAVQEATQIIAQEGDTDGQDFF